MHMTKKFYEILKQEAEEFEKIHGKGVFYSPKALKEFEEVKDRWKNKQTQLQ